MECTEFGRDRLRCACVGFCDDDLRSDVEIVHLMHEHNCLASLGNFDIMVAGTEKECRELVALCLYSKSDTEPIEPLFAPPGLRTIAERSRLLNGQMKLTWKSKLVELAGCLCPDVATKFRTSGSGNFMLSLFLHDVNVRHAKRRADYQDESGALRTSRYTDSAIRCLIMNPQLFSVLFPERLTGL